METGKISVETENIFPIIKKFLYSDHEIFLRELVSNAVDATQKLKVLASKGNVKGETGDLTIHVTIDEKKKTLTIEDKGIGMTEEEVKKYINQIAFSSAEEFLQKYKDKSDGASIIGHFGLGFYSAFMVADKVDLKTRSYQENSEPVHWSCDGSPNYQIEKTKKKDRGTEVTLHINEESKEFLDKHRIKTLLTKYCKFLPVEIKFDGEIINNPNPAWTKKPSELTDKDYQDFYKELYPFSEAPLFWIHLNVDYPFNLTGILYFPKLKNSFEVQKNKIHLYSNQVFVTDAVQEIMPEFLMMLHGVIDSPDIPLNVSRSYLQSDPNVKKINNHITKKVADKLEELYKKDRKGFEEKWEHISVFVKYGMMTDDKFYDKMKSVCLFETIDNKFYTLDEYKDAVKEAQLDKNKKTVFIYTNNEEEQHSYIQSAKKRDYKILKLDSLIDSHFIGLMEQKNQDIHFTRIDSESIDNLIEKDEKTESVLTESQEKLVKELFEGQVNNKLSKVELKSMSPDDQPVVITRPEFSRRMKEMAATGGGMSFMGDMPEQLNVIVNANHPIVNKLLVETDTEKQKQVTKQLYDLALLSQNMLRGEALTNFIERSVKLI